MTPRVSIAMATYNGARYLPEQLRSFCMQTRMPDELVACDDGSTDETLKILEAFRKDAPFKVVVESNPVNLGFTRNFELALTKCTGDLIFLCDQDDIWLQCKIERMLAAFAANPEKTVLIHDAALVNHEMVRSDVSSFSQVRSGFGSDDHVTTGALTALRREFMLISLPIPEGIVGHDIWVHGLAKLLDTRLVVNESLQFLRRHSANTSDWIGASLHPISRLNVLVHHYKTPIAQNYSDRVHINESLRNRLHWLQASRAAFASGVLARGLVSLAAERQALAGRTRLIGDPPLRRRLLAVRFLLSGHYRHFNGLGSFLRDISR